MIKIIGLQTLYKDIKIKNEAYVIFIVSIIKSSL